MKKIILLLFLQCVVLGQASVQDTIIFINFENEQDSMIRFDHQMGTKWEIGKPQKTILDSAISLNNAIITDSVNPYVTNTLTSFRIPILPTEFPGTMGFLCPLAICYKYKNDNNPTHAGHRLEIYSTSDSTLTMLPLTDFQSYSGAGFYYYINSYSGSTLNFDTLSNSNVIYTNANNTTHSFCHEMAFLGVSPHRASDTLWFKFTFESDSTTNFSAGGVLIDDISIGKGIGFCGGNITENNILPISISPNPTNGIMQISNPNEVNLKNYLLYDLSGKVLKQENITESIIDISELNTGIYFIKINSPEGSLIEKIIKE